MNQKLHIVFISSWYPSIALPHNGDFVQRHAEAVAKLHQVTVCHVVSYANQDKNIEETEANINGVRTLITYVKPSWLKSFYFIFAYVQLFKKVGKYDLIHANILYPVGIIALVNKWLTHKKYIISEHHTIYLSPSDTDIGWMRKKISQRIAKNAAFIAPVTQHLAEAMQEQGLKSNYVPVPNVVDVTLFSPIKKEENTTFKLLHVSSMDQQKQIPLLLEAVALLQNHIADFKFYLIGKNAAKFADKANELQIDKTKIEFIAHLEHKQLVKYYQNADVFLLFSETENLPCVILESFSVGTPVICNRVGGIHEYFPENFGKIVAKDDITSFVNAIIDLYKKRYQASPKAMHQYVEQHFSQESIAQSFSTLYYSMLEKKPL